MNERRQFTAVNPATITEPTALSIGLYSFTGQGKTECSLRLAFGIRRVTGRRVVLADCDNGRGLQYVRGTASVPAMFPEAEYIDFAPPYNALCYVDLLEQFERENVILIIDNMSAEHEGEGGLLDTKEANMYNREGVFKEGREAVAWGVAKGQHKQLVRVFPRVNRKIPIIITWRAKDGLDWGAKNDRGKIEPKKEGEVPIGSKTLPYEMTATYLLPPGSRGAPLLNPVEKNEQLMTKIPRWFEGIVKPGEKFTEAHGEAMARWAFGAPKATTQAPLPSTEHDAAIAAYRTRLSTAAAEGADAVQSIARELAKAYPKGHPVRVAVNPDYLRAKARAEGEANPDAEPPPPG